MRHIDSFKYEIVGLFAGLPVYHPLENIEGEFKCTSNQLVIGGGSGEHPALVLEDPLAAVAWFIYEALETLDNDSNIFEEWEDIINPYLNYDSDEILKYYAWTIETFHSFAEICKSEGLPNPFRGSVNSIESWLILGFGEFIYYAMPDLAGEIMSKLKKPYKQFHHMLFNNILLIPPNFPVYANGGNIFGNIRARSSQLLKEKRS